MKFSFGALVAVVALAQGQTYCDAFSSTGSSTVAITRQRTGTNNKLTLPTTTTARHVASLEQPEVEGGEVEPIDLSAIFNMPFRQLQHHCRARGLESSGTTNTLRQRLRELCQENMAECVVGDSDAPAADDDDDETYLSDNFEFINEADPDFEFKQLVTEIQELTAIGHWKTATRKLKKLKKHYAHPATDRPVPEEAYSAVLHACCQHRLHGARASERARRIMEDMADEDVPLPADLVNYGIQNCLGYGENATHDGFGGIDCALAMKGAADIQNVELTEETYGKLATALCKAGEWTDGLATLRSMVADKRFTPSLLLFADIAMAAAEQTPEHVLTVLAFAKAAGYELDKIASTVDGRSMLAAGLMAADAQGNVALGLRLLTAASKAGGCAPDRGDDLVVNNSAKTLQASLRIHKKAIRSAVMDGEWKLACRLLELMLERSLRPSPTVWRNVVTCCSKAEKSRKATALLLDWVKMSEEGLVDKPPLAVFNTVVNACEICDEQSLTLMVLEAMKRTHETDGNIITFNIALKRLAKQGMIQACEGIIIGMLQNGVEPSVVSYTTAVAACVEAAKKGDSKAPSMAYEWIKRMRSRNVMPNRITYNTALAACLANEGPLEATMLGSEVCDEWMVELKEKLPMLVGTEDDNRDDEEAMIQRLKDAASTLSPDLYSRTLAKNLMKQLRQNWRDGSIDMQEAKATVRVPLLKIVDFEKSSLSSEWKEAVAKLKEESASNSKKKTSDDEDDKIAKTDEDDEALDYEVATVMHRTAEI